MCGNRPCNSERVSSNLNLVVDGVDMTLGNDIVQSSQLSLVPEIIEFPLEFEILDERFSSTLRRTLKNKEELNRTLRSELLQTLYEQLMDYTDKPTKTNYHDVTKSLIKKYPYLAARTVTSDALKYWKTRISMKFRNSRRENIYNNVKGKENKKQFNVVAPLVNSGSMSASTSIRTLPKLEILNQEISTAEDFMFFPSIEDNIVINAVEQCCRNQAIDPFSSLTGFYD